MKIFFYTALIFSLAIVSCGSSKVYFTSAIRNDVEASHQSLQKVQFYADRDIVLRRDMDIGETKVKSGVVKIENGHYVNIITLKKHTPGVCTIVKGNAIGVSFEQGDNKFLTFGKTKYANPEDPYRILANDWVNDYGVIMYDGKQYYIQPQGTEAGIMIKTSVLKKSVVEEREMKGRKVANVR
jgi:hypothetical protein